MADESEQARADPKRHCLQELDDDFKAVLDDPVHDIVERVRKGILTRAEAEAWAVEHGRPPFASKPDASTFDPRGKRNWTLAQMAAWAIWRTDDAVRAVSEEYVSRCVVWIELERPERRFVTPVEWEFTSSTDRVGYELGTPKVGTAHDVMESARHRAFLGGDPAPALNPERARHELLDALQAGDPLVARHGEGEAIDRFLWDGLLSFDSDDGPHDAVFYPSGKVVRFYRVRVERDAVLAVWPPVLGEAGPKPAEGPEETSAPEVTAMIVERTVEVGSTRSGPKPQITGDKLAAMLRQPPMDDTINSDAFLTEARRRARRQERGVDQNEVRALYVTMHGKKGSGRPSGRKSRRTNPVE